MYTKCCFALSVSLIATIGVVAVVAPLSAQTSTPPTQAQQADAVFGNVVSQVTYLKDVIKMQDAEINGLQKQLAEKNAAATADKSKTVEMPAPAAAAPPAH